MYGTTARQQHNFTVRSDNCWAQMQIRRIKEGEFPGDPVVRTVGFRCWAHGFSDSLFGKLRPGGKMMDENNPLWVFWGNSGVWSCFSCDFLYQLLQTLMKNPGPCGGMQTSCSWKVMGAPSWEGQECPPLPPPPHQDLEESESVFHCPGGRRSPSELGRERIYSRIDVLTFSTYYCVG